MAYKQPDSPNSQPPKGDKYDTKTNKGFSVPVVRPVNPQSPAEKKIPTKK